MAVYFLSLEEQRAKGILISKKEKYEKYINDRMNVINELHGDEQNKAICNFIKERAKPLNCSLRKNGKKKIYNVIRWRDIPLQLNLKVIR